MFWRISGRCSRCWNTGSYCSSIPGALGIPPVFAIVGALVFNGIAASLGAAGLTTIGGFAAFLDVVDVMDISKYTSFIHFFGALLAPILVLVIFVGEKGTG